MDVQERGGDTEKPRQCPTLFRMSLLVLLHAQCIALIVGRRFKVSFEWLGPAGNRTHDPWLNNLACYPMTMVRRYGADI